MSSLLALSDSCHAALDELRSYDNVLMAVALGVGGVVGFVVRKETRTARAQREMRALFDQAHDRVRRADKD